MCGIAGILSVGSSLGPDREALLQERLLAMSRLMARRGPDGEGSWRSETGDVRLAFRRLAILDLRPEADQPMVSRRAPCALVFNGEIYNWLELRRELEDRGVRFHTRCDAEVLLEALVEWGPDVLPRLNGMFALAFWDGRRRTLWLARDRFGMKPLFYARAGDDLYFGSQLDQLWVDPRLRAADVDLHGLASFLGHGYVPPPHTLLSGLFQLEPGCCLKVERGGSLPSPSRYVPPLFEHPLLEHSLLGPRVEPFAEAGSLQEALASALDGSIRRHLMADVPRGVFLSSGVDSSLVALTVKQHEQSFFSCTAIGDSGAVDESEAVSEFAGRHGIQTHLVMIRRSEAERLWRQFVAAYPDPHANISSLARLDLSRRAKQDATVMLSGDGGDELFYGYSRMWRQLAMARWHRRPKWLGRLGRGVRKLSRGRWLRYTTTLGYDGPAEHYSEMLRFCTKSADIVRFCPALKESLAETDLCRGFETELLERPFEAARQVEARKHLDYCLAVADRTTMFHGIECRVPLLDLEVMAVAERTPAELCLGVGQGKMPLRHRLAELCRESAKLPKRGFEVPPFEGWMRGPLRPMIDEALSGDFWPEGLWSEKAVDALRSGKTEGPEAVALSSRFAVAVLQAWRREFLS